MDKTERVATRVITLLVQVLQIDIDPEDIADDEPLFGDELDADSMLSLELISAIEEAFGIEVTTMNCGWNCSNCCGAWSSM